jgi:hypothetical protein
VKCVLVGRMMGGWCSRRIAGGRISSVGGVREKPRTIGLFVLRSTGGSVVGRCDDEHFPTAPLPFWRLDDAKTNFCLTSSRDA